MEDLVELFIENDVDGILLLKLTDSDLNEMGVANGFHRRKILTKFETYIAQLMKQGH